LYGTALVLEEFGNVIAADGAGVVIASQSGHRLAALTAEQDRALAMTPADELVDLPMLQPDEVTDPLHAYQLSKRGNALRVMAEAVRWGKRGARVNTISPGIIITPLAKDELTGPRGEGYRRMIELCPAGRAGTPDEVGVVGALLMGPSLAVTSSWMAESPPYTAPASSLRGRAPHYERVQWFTARNGCCEMPLATARLAMTRRGRLVACEDRMGTRQSGHAGTVSRTTIDRR
jgi:hypothetical protein